MNDPSGFRIVRGRVVDVKPWAALFNSALWPEATHLILGAFIVSGCLVATPHAWALLRGRGTRYHRTGLALALTVAMVAAPVQIVVGDWAARHVAAKQPTKLAALEGVTSTVKRAPLHIGGLYIDGEVNGAIRIPDLLSLLAYDDPNATVQGLDAVPAADRPPVNVVRTSFQLMVAIGFAFLALGAWLGIAWRRRRALPQSRWFLRSAVAAGPAAVVALECGWVVTEVGRQPWIVYHVMRTRDAVSDASGLRYGYFLLIVVYVVLAIATFSVLRRLARAPLPDGGA